MWSSCISPTHFSSLQDAEGAVVSTPLGGDGDDVPLAPWQIMRGLWVELAVRVSF